MTAPPDALPPVEAVLPQSGPMRLLSEIVSHSDKETLCRVDVARSELFQDDEGRVGAWVAIEYMAQCAAAHGGLIARAHGEGPQPGLLLGTRRLLLETDSFQADRPLLVRARPAGADARIVMFACSVETADGRILAEGRVTVYILKHLGDFEHER